MEYTTKDLQDWDEKIVKIVKEIGLNCYPQEFEICNQNEMLGYTAYTGMPSHYPHWSFGKAFERQRMLYKLGLSGLPYEMVINSNPCLAYLMKDNTLLLQILTIAHVYGHNDFFKNNETFKFSEADYVVEMFKSHADRIRSYIEDPSIGLTAVENVLDAAHSLKYQCRRNLNIKSLTIKEQRSRAIQAANENYRKRDPLRAEEYQAPDIHKIPIEPESDILLFVRDYNPMLEDWQKDILTIVAEENQYFLPQIETKIMNEGWASYWHYQILNKLNLPQGLHIEFLKRHNSVICPHVGGLNPYHMGFKIFENIFQRWENPSDEDKEEFGLPGGQGLQKIMQVRETDRDQSFLRQYLTKDLMMDIDLFQHEVQGNDRVVTKISSEDEDWKQIRDTLILNVGMNRVPRIDITDANYQGHQILFLTHINDGRDLEVNYAQHTLCYLEKLWGKKVILYSKATNGKKYHFESDDGHFEIKEIK